MTEQEAKLLEEIKALASRGYTKEKFLEMLAKAFKELR